VTVRFERGGDEEEDDERPLTETGNRWYFFIPVLMLGLWLLVGIAQLLASALVPRGPRASSDAAADTLLHALAMVDLVGGLGLLLLFPFYLVVLANKRASAWWSLGVFCCGVNLLLYVVLLFMPARRRFMAPDLSGLQPRETEKALVPSTYLLKHSFVCESCDSLINYGVSECPQCGERYRYVDGKPQADESAP